MSNSSGKERGELKKLFVDSHACIGCHLCEIVCSLAHLKDEVNPRKARIRVHEDSLNYTFKPVVCKQCTRAACVEACPSDALHQGPGLKVPVVDSARCNACLSCLEACPFGAMFYDEDEKIPLVCDLCGGDPRCAKFCPTHPTKTHAALNYTSPLMWSRIKTNFPGTEGKRDAC